MAKASTIARNEVKGEFKVRLGELKLASEAPPEIREKLMVRKSDDRFGIEELEASIRHTGIVYPLIIDTQHNAMYVTAGNRRLKCLRKIYGDNDADIRVVDTRDFNADEREVAMAVNITLPPHPIDRYEVLSAQVRAGLSREQIGARNAMGLKAVDRVLALADLAPEIKEAYRDDEIDDKTAQAFTLGTPDEQIKLFNRLNKDGRLYDHLVTGHFVAKQRDVGAIVEFVGLEAYEAAGGKVKKDLFDTHNHTVDDLKLLQKMHREKMKGVCAAIVEKGWSFAMTPDEAGDQRYYYGTENGKDVKPTAAEAKRIEELTEIAASGGEFDDETPEQTAAMEEIDSINAEIKSRGYTDEQKAKFGCFVSLTNSGKIKIEYGKIRPAERKKVEAQQRAKDRKAANPAASDGQKKKTEAPIEGRVSNKLVELMSSWLVSAAKEVIVKEPHVAFAAILAGCASHDDTCDIRARDSSRDKRPDFAGVFATQLKATTAQQMATLAEIASASLSFHTYNSDAPPLADKGVAALCNALNAKAMNKAIEDHFDAKLYFDSVSAAMIKRAISEAGFTEDQAKTAKKKTKELAKFALMNVPATGWLPPQLRLESYAGPKAAAAKKPKAAKKAAAPKNKK